MKRHFISIAVGLAIVASPAMAFADTTSNNTTSTTTPTSQAGSTLAFSSNSVSQSTSDNSSATSPWGTTQSSYGESFGHNVGSGSGGSSDSSESHSYGDSHGHGQGHNFSYGHTGSKSQGQSQTSSYGHSEGESASHSKRDFGLSHSKKGILLGGKNIENVEGVTYNKTMYMPIWYVQQVLKALGFSSTWDGSHWNITSPGSSSGTVTGSVYGSAGTSNNPSGIEINGQSVASVSGQVYQNTTYMPIWYVMQALKNVGVQSTWNGQQWGLTESN